MTNTMTNLKKGQTITCGYRRASWTSTFIGFSDSATAHSNDVAFDDWKALRAAKGFKTFADLDAEAEASGRPYGHSHYALFMDEDGMVWGAYRYNGYWAVGSSADRLSLNA